MKKIITIFTLTSIFLFSFISTKTVQADTPAINPSRAEIEIIVSIVFSSAPDMIAVARCESTFRQFADSGNVFRGHDHYIGIFQIDENLHRAPALAMGYDIDTVVGNILYAKYMYDHQGGTRPWLDCMPVPQPTPPANPPADVPPTTPSDNPNGNPPSTTFTLTLNLEAGMVDEQVRTLQQILNSHGFPIAPSGPGSLGNETTKYGTLTRAAVQKFQCAKNVVCPLEGEFLPGYGYVGPLTRAALKLMVETPPVTANP